MLSVPVGPEVLLQARDIAFAHPPDAEGHAFRLNVAALDVYVGEVLALCGRSGSGKSTLLAILAGLLRPQTGEVLLKTDDGPRPVDPHVPRYWRAMRRHFGFVHQDPREYLNDRRRVADIVADPLNIQGLLPARPESLNVADTAGSRGFRGGTAFGLFGMRQRWERRERAIAELQKVGLGSEHAERRPEALSGGQRQRVAIARALVAQPQLVFLDEPTSALDVSVQASILALLQALRQASPRRSYVLVTHDLPLARQLADRVAILDEGRIVELGEADRVLGQPASAAARELLGVASAQLGPLAEPQQT